MNIYIENGENLQIEVKVLQACLARCAAYAVQPDIESVEITIAERTSMAAPLYRGPGMLVYRMKVVGPGNCLYIEAVSPKPHLSVEFH